MVRTHLLQAFISTLPYHDNESHSINRMATPLLMVASTRNNRSSRPKPKSTPRGKGRQQQLKLQPKQRAKTISISEAKTMGEAIQLAQSISDHLTIVDKFVWLPTDDKLKPHLRTQLIHNEKRKRWGSQLLEGIGQAALSSWENNPMELKHALMTMEGGEGKIWFDTRLVRTIKSVALPMEDGNNKEDIVNNDREMVWIADAIKGLHVLSGCIKPTAPSKSQDMQLWIDMLSSISMLVQSVDRLSGRISLKDAVEVRFAIRGLVKRLQIANMDLSSLLSNMDDMSITADTLIDFTIPNLNARTSNLPFDIFPHVLPWQMSSLNDSNYFGYPTQELLPSLLESIPFNFDTLTTRNGESVIERRGTAWLAEEGIGALAYSGKLMRPDKVGGLAREIMRDIEQWCLENGQHEQSLQTGTTSLTFKWSEDITNLAYEGIGQFLEQEYQHHEQPPTFFDCALCNHYPDGESACKYHTDPEHGSLWHRTTAVVSCGTSRIFAFRPIPDISTWSEWDDMPITKDSNNMAAAIQLFPGDLVLMTGSCNDKFHHAVYSSPFDKVGNSRVSLVLKRALDRKGMKGHGLKGEGRRSKSRNRLQQQYK